MAGLPESSSVPFNLSGLDTDMPQCFLSFLKTLHLFLKSAVLMLFTHPKECYTSRPIPISLLLYFTVILDNLKLSIVNVPIHISVYFDLSLGNGITRNISHFFIKKKRPIVKEENVGD